MKAALLIHGAWRQQPYRLPCPGVSDAHRQARNLGRKADITRIVLQVPGREPEVLKES